MRHQEFNFIFPLIIFILLSCSEIPIDSVTPNRAFPSHTTYTGVHIKPNNQSQEELDNDLKEFYNSWRDQYLKSDCNEGEYYIKSKIGEKTISEAHGYGMMIFAFMAGYEKSAKTIFDGLYNYYKSHPSNNNSYLMDWKQKYCNDEPSSDDDSASDGDIDIAFALLLANNQWGSDGEINYLGEAKLLIAAIKKDDINQTLWSIKLGDWSTPADSNYDNSTRTSDFITSHFRSFKSFTIDNDWDLVINECYSLIEEIHNPTTGLMPDFIIDIEGVPTPAQADFLESIYDGDYYYNSCRFPWRIGVDYLLNSEERAKTSLIRLNRWLKETTGGDPSKISNGYKLDGTAINSWSNATFIAPFTVGAMVDSENQEWLNKLYETIIEESLLSGDYYSNTIKLLSLITISGNYWSPE